jgi:hypothetical protein
MDSLNYLDIRNNYLDISPASVAWNVITNLQNRFAYDPNYDPVDYSPQSMTTALTIFDQPADQCISAGASAYFAFPPQAPPAPCRCNGNLTTWTSPSRRT